MPIAASIASETGRDRGDQGTWQKVAIVYVLVGVSLKLYPYAIYGAIC